MLAASSELCASYTLEENFRALFNQNLKITEAEKQLQNWVMKVEALPFKAVKEKEQLENQNLLNRRGFGYQNFKSFRLHV